MEGGWGEENGKEGGRVIEGGSSMRWLRKVEGKEGGTRGAGGKGDRRKMGKGKGARRERGY